MRPPANPPSAMRSPVTLPFMRLRRWGFLGLAAATTGAGGWMMLHILGGGGFTVLEALILALFLPTFAWIVIPFWTAVAGFVLRILDRDPLTLGSAAADGTAGGRHGEGGCGSARTTALTALVVPVYNEDPSAVSARISAMARSLRRAGGDGRFHVHILSDTSDPAVAREEERAWVRLQAGHPEIPVHYRRRARNQGRKAGNIGEFCRRCRDDYTYMVVLDADSLMTGETLLELVAMMEADPELGLIQTVPLPVRQRTLFGRLVQFAGCLYGPLLAAGQAFWQGDAANYWGHNAILRLRPFAEHGGLPLLPGRPPLGGEILSHDFVEGAFLRRAGWKVLLHPTLGGSWEEVPGTVVDFARRDRRWAQGSLQHLRLLREPGLHPLSRLHFLLGAMGYVSSLLWLLTLLAGTAYVLLPVEGFPAAGIPLPGGPAALSLLAVTGVILFLPKLLGVVLGMVRDRRRFGGGVRLVAGAALETLFSVLLAPVMMLHHARFVVGIALGRTVEWEPQDRDGAILPWSRTFRAGGWITAVGVVWGGVTLALSPLFFLWMSPIFAGLLLAVPLLRWTSSPGLGEAARARGLLLVPSETGTVPVVGAVDWMLRRDEPAGPGAPRSGHGSAAGADLRGHTGVFQPPMKNTSSLPRTPHRSMHNAERGLFDLRQGRPVLVTGPGAEAILVAAVEGLDDAGLERLRRLGGGAAELVLTAHRVAAMGLTPPGTNGGGPLHYALPLEPGAGLERVLALSCHPRGQLEGRGAPVVPADPRAAAGLALVHLGRLLPAVVSAPVSRPRSGALDAALESGAVLRVSAEEICAFVDASGVEVERLSEAPVPLAEAEDSRFILFREVHGLQEHVAILVGNQDEWPDPLPVRLHSACLTGDLFGSLRCDCGEQLRGSMELFAARGGGVLLYLAQEGRGIGLRNKFRAYTLQEGGLDTIDADGTLGFGADERRYDVAARILEAIGVERIELLTNNPEKVRAMEAAGITVSRRRPLHGTLNRHNLPYVRAKVQRAGHWLGDMLSQPLVSPASPQNGRDSRSAPPDAP